MAGRLVDTGTDVPSKMSLGAAFAILFIVLLMMAQFGSTEQLAAALAYLVLVAVIMAYGITAAKNISPFWNSLMGIGT